jgi:hypothetical protein
MVFLQVLMHLIIMKAQAGHDSEGWGVGTPLVWIFVLLRFFLLLRMELYFFLFTGKKREP